MPELPEVEVVRSGLAEHITGATVIGTEVLHPRAVRGQPGGAAALEAPEDARITAPRRRGKYLWIDLSTRADTRVNRFTPDPDAASWSTPVCPGRCCSVSRQVTSPHLRIRSVLVADTGGN